MAESPHGDDLFTRFPRLRARVAELGRRVKRRAPPVAARVAADLGSGSDGGRTPGEPAAGPLVIRSIIDLVEGRSLRIEGLLGEILGVSEREIMESSFLERVHPDDRLRTVRAMERVAGGMVLEGFRIRHLHADGGYRVFEWSAVADDAGELCYAVAQVLDEKPSSLS